MWRLVVGTLLWLSATLLLAGEASAQCRNPGQTCGVFGGSCCSGSSCIIGICVANPPSCTGEGGLCVSSSSCCGSRVCEIGFCRTPVGMGEACGPAAPCQSGLTCDPLAGFRCVGHAGIGEACGPLVLCEGGLVCDPLSGFVCIDDSAGLGDACGPLVHCTSGLVCDPLAGFRCVDQSAELGEACGPLVQCVAGLVCDPFAGLVCVDQSAELGDACGPLVQCSAGLVCDLTLRCIDQSAELGQACGPLVHCVDGLVCDPLAGFVCVDQSVGEGQACGPLVQCGPDLFCDPFAGFRCVAAAGVDQPCGPGVPCEGGLQCTLALRCSHDPAQTGETCDVTAPCDDGLFCQAGIPQRCRPLRKPGEGCSAFNPCLDGASCELCLVSGCNSTLQCFWNANEGAITENQCRVLYSPNLQAAAVDAGLTMTYSVGDEAAAILGESQSFGVAYGQDGRYGCFTTLCGGINADVGIEAFVSVGFYTGFDAVGGSSFANFQEAQLPGNVLNFSTSQVFAREDVLPLPELIGTEDCFAVGVGPDILPFSAGSFLCETVLDTVIDPAMGETPAPLAVAPDVVANAGLTFSLAGWTCLDGGLCSWVEDDAIGSAASGSARVTSPHPDSGSDTGALASSCVSVMPRQGYELSAWVRTLGALDGSLWAIFYPSTDCSGEVVASALLGTSPPDDTWRRLADALESPAGAQSLRFEVTAARDLVSGAESSSLIDLVQVPEPAGLLAGAAALLAARVVARVRRRARR